ncbi:MAG TPA: TetR/AcrR family transcriptional regulator [Actinomycetota bacterium]|nr:TetR/AcrR family transcriptional regulator [Actinomycetota bacterium]
MPEAAVSHESRAPGRPRSLEADRSILSAALDLFIEDGYQGMSIEHVAAQAGVGKATIYRRWPSKEALITDAVCSFSEELTAPDTGAVRDDMLGLVRQIVELASSSPSGRCFARMAGEMISNPELAKVYKEKVIGHRRAIVRQIIVRGMDRGELRDDLDVGLVVDMLVGPLLYRALIKRAAPSETAGMASAFIDTLLVGIAAQS